MYRWIYRKERPSTSATTMPMSALVAWIAPASHALAAHSAKTNAPIMMVETIANTTVRFNTNPTSTKRLLTAAYVKTTGTTKYAREVTQPTTIVPAYDDDNKT